MIVTQQQFLTNTQSLSSTQTVTTFSTVTGFSTITRTTTTGLSSAYNQNCPYYGCSYQLLRMLLSATAILHISRLRYLRQFQPPMQVHKLQPHRPMHRILGPEPKRMHGASNSNKQPVYPGKPRLPVLYIAQLAVILSFPRNVGDCDRSTVPRLQHKH